MKKYKNMWIFIVYIFIITFFSIVNYSENVFNDISDEVLRLHVIANSNSEEDQKVKLLVRDRVLEYMKNNSNKFKNKEEAISFLNSDLKVLEKIVKNVLYENNFEYNVNIKIDDRYFPTKNYSKYSFPMGKYDALVIELGEGVGNNWWCVMFPPLCFINEDIELEEYLLKENMNNEAYLIVCDNSNETKIKFKMIEFVESIKNYCKR